MRRRTSILVAGSAAALLLAIGTVSASANKISASNRSFRIVWSPLELISGVGTVRCPITLEGSFHTATIGKVARALIGQISRANVTSSACTGGRATVNQEALPWHGQYASFTGTLPTITGITMRMVGAKYTLETGGLLCTTITTEANPARGIAIVGAGGRITGMRSDETSEMPLRGGFFCEIGGNGRFAGTGSLTLLGNTSSIFVRLI